MYFFRVVRQYYRRLVQCIVRVRVNNSEAICIVDMKKLARPNRCIYTGLLSCYKYTIATEKNGKFSKVEYIVGALAIARLIVEHSKELVIHPGNESSDVSICLTMLVQAIDHRQVFINRHVKRTLEYIEC